MATTAKGIVYPTVGTTLTPLSNHFASLASSADAAIGATVTTATEDVAAFKGTDAERLALSGASYPVLAEGLEWYSTDTNIKWFYNGTSWVGGPATLTPSAGITLNHRVNRIGNLVVFAVDVTKATDMTTNEIVTTLPAAFRPTKDMTGGLHLSGGFGVITATFSSVLTTGEVRVNALGVAGVRNVFFNFTWVV